MRSAALILRREKHESRFLFLRVALSLLILSTFFIATTTLHAQGGAVRVETFNLISGGQVRVENLRGATRIEVWDFDSVRVVAEKKTPAGAVLDPTDLILMGIQNTLTVQCRQSPRAGRIDLTISVPRNARLQLLGGTWPVDVNGALASAVVETTSGAIAYRLPANDDASVVMRSARGVVRSSVPLTVSERTGTQSLQGRLGGGTAPIILNSQTGNITLTPGPNVSMIAMASNDATGVAMDDAASAQRQPATVQGQRRNARPMNSPGTINNHQTSAPDYDADVADNAPMTSTQRAPRGSSSAPSSTNNTVEFAGGDRADDGSLSVTGGGAFQRPKQERRTSGGSSGLRVRIIPSGTPLNSANEPSRSSYDQPDDVDASSSRQPAPGGSRSNSTMKNGSRSSQADNDADIDFGRPARSTNVPQPRQSSRSASRPLPDDPSNEPSTMASRNARPNAPPVLQRNNEDATVEAPATATTRSDADTDEEAVVLKSALVNLNVTVTNRSGMALANLKKEEFEIAENGQAQRIEFFAPQSAPFNLVLVLDLSGSIKDKIDVVKAAALRFIDVIGPQDKVAVVTFTQDIRVVSQLTADRNELKRRIKSIDSTLGGTAFYEAMWFTLADTLRGTRGQRNAIVVMTDGVDSSLDRYNPAPTRVNFDQLAHRLEESDVLIFPVYLDTEYEEVFERMNSTSEAYAIARDQLQRVAELTGGQMFRAEKVGDLSGVYKQVAAAIRTVYSVGYYPTNAEHDGTFRRVRVVVNRPDAAVRTRKGYYAK